MDKNYFPIVKTTDAEIKGLKNLDQKLFKNVCPIMELTRSRPVKNFPEGDIHRRMEALEEIFKESSFILDLTSHEDLSNNQIFGLQDDTNGFSEWRAFLKKYKHLNIIPALHYYEDEPLVEFSNQARLVLEAGYRNVAIRISVQSRTNQVDLLIQALGGLMEDFENVYFVFDADYVNEGSYGAILNWFRTVLDKAKDRGVNKVITASSSFPKSVLERPVTSDSSGRMNILERDIYGDLAQFSSNDFEILYSDYASIHPIRLSQSGGQWVPRIDLSIDGEYVYKRYRQKDGGYERAAAELVQWAGVYDPVDCWGASEIENAADGDLGGRSPSHWISVRLNQHISRFSEVG